MKTAVTFILAAFAATALWAAEKGASSTNQTAIKASLVRGDPSRHIAIAVDASVVGRRRIPVRVTIPAPPGPLTLVYPRWLRP